MVINFHTKEVKCVNRGKVDTRKEQEIKAVHENVIRKMNGKKPNEILEMHYGEDVKIPVDIVAVAKSIGIRLGSIDFTELEKQEPFRAIVGEDNHILGAAYIRDNGVQIVYQNSLHKIDGSESLSDVDKDKKLHRRQRFTIAHEIAHCCFDLTENDTSHIEYRTDDAVDKEKEKKANIFAGELLIPYDFLEIICSLLKGVISISLLADMFDVSRKVMKARIEYVTSTGKLTEYKFV